jgi:hypothetical protein
MKKKPKAETQEIKRVLLPNPMETAGTKLLLRVGSTMLEFKKIDIAIIDGDTTYQSAVWGKPKKVKK